MKRGLLLIAVMLMTVSITFAQDRVKYPSHAAAENDEIHWLTMDQLQEKMKEAPKKVYIDFYTSWCGWCKKMDATTMKNPELIKYMNKHFYSVRFDAERKDTVWFMRKPYYYEPKYKANTFAVEYLRGQMSYPTLVIMEEFYQNPQPVPGYHPVEEMEQILKYFGEDAYKKTPWADYQKSFKGSWENTP